MEVIFTNNAARPDVLAAMRQYFPANSVKLRGRRGYCRSIFTNDSNASMVLYLDEGRFYCFSSCRSGDAFDVVSMATGRPVGELLRERNTDYREVRESRAKAEEWRRSEQERRFAVWRIGSLYRVACEERRRLAGCVEDGGEDANLALLARVLWSIFDRLTGSEEEAKQAIIEAKMRGLL